MVTGVVSGVVRRAVAAVLVVAGLVACEQVAAQAYDQPKRFAEKGDSLGVSLSTDGAVPALLHDKLVYAVAEGGVRAVDVTSGQVIWHAESRWGSSAGSGYGPPAQVRVGGRSLVLAVFAGDVEGSGTSKGHTEGDLVALDAHTGKRLWRKTIRLPSVEEGSEPPPVTLAGVTSKVAVVGYANRTYAVDLRSRKTVWSRSDVIAWALTGGVVVGVRKLHRYASTSYVAGVDADGGTLRWTARRGWSKPSIALAGPGQVTVQGTDYDDGTEGFALVRASSGRTLDHRSYGTAYGSSGPPCHYDDRSVTVCEARNAQKSIRVLFAYTRAGKPLWTVATTAKREAPALHTAFHGIVYAELVDGRGETQARLLLDARTGKDRKGDPGVLPALVSRFGALVVAGGDASVHRATG